MTHLRHFFCKIQFIFFLIPFDDFGNMVFLLYQY